MKIGTIAITKEERNESSTGCATGNMGKALQRGNLQAEKTIDNMGHACNRVCEIANL